MSLPPFQIGRGAGQNTCVQGSHGHEISGKVLKLENKFSSTGKVLELSKSWSRSWKVLDFFVYALFLAIDFVKKKKENHIQNI